MFSALAITSTLDCCLFAHISMLYPYLKTVVLSTVRRHSSNDVRLLSQAIEWNERLAPEPEEEGESGGKKTRVTRKTSMGNHRAPTTPWNMSDTASTQDTLAKHLRL
ncbi:uncharacterized protein BT62DRAFT_1002781 [Guyanagaster necrorhizus]|uniref:Uncharacterized protein n=1 Tax=Guyanagaster necrorhizus TaxID=856835 RepID=A0A9P8AV62_9AGAR|nr:uncharacterized protein BT62DRAFT_1002781 [Guyanagaster necrorhizus MCA 3950]KAG7449209.1 hypothetical protein BT62DRAFT_1002781 [Guyanagaster necrorhizus MCA 3950]